MCSHFATFSGYLINSAQSVSVTIVTIPSSLLHNQNNAILPLGLAGSHVKCGARPHVDGSTPVAF